MILVSGEEFVYGRKKGEVAVEAKEVFLNFSKCWHVNCVDLYVGPTTREEDNQITIANQEAHSRVGVKTGHSLHR